LNERLEYLTLLRLLQLASPALPVGAYAYSQGLEWAVAAGWVNDESSLANWLTDQLTHSLAGVDVPMFGRLYEAARSGDDEEQLFWSRYLIALRETRELVADDCDRGRALARLLRDLEVRGAGVWVARQDVPFAALAAIAAVAWEIPATLAAHAYVWSWLENQVLVGVKLIPLGQVAGQRLLLDLARRIPAACADGLARSDDEIGGMLPIVALASSLHETQYTRLFRS
jgi:urease accessory protein